MYAKRAKNGLLQFVRTVQKDLILCLYSIDIKIPSMVFVSLYRRRSFFLLSVFSGFVHLH